VIKPFYAMMGAPGVEDDAFLVVGEPEWYDHKTEISLGTGGMLVTTIFGLIHCIGWWLDFPSHAEQLLWRISSITIIGIPVGIVAIGAILRHFEGLFTILVILLTLLYTLSRVLLLVVSFTALRSLPSSAFQTVEWTTFLPHV
jgi:hypothetical protein